MDAIVDKKVKIISSGCYLPNQRVKSDHLFEEFGSEQNYNIPTNWMSSKMGIIERRMANDEALPSDLAIPAAREALQDFTETEKKKINLVIFCGIERDQPEPATTHTIQHALGLNACHTLDLSNACFGFMQAMEVASLYIKGGLTEYALIVTGEVPTRVLKAALSDLKKGTDIARARQILGALSVGDAGGAVVLGPSYGYEAAGFELFNTVSDSSHVEKCIYRTRTDGTIEGQMLMGPIVREIINKQIALLPDTLRKLNWTEFDWMLSHQMGQKPFDRLSRLEGVQPEKMTKTFDLLGNITSATFVVNFHKLIKSGKVKSGDRMGGFFAGSGLVIGQIGYTF